MLIPCFCTIYANLYFYVLYSSLFTDEIMSYVPGAVPNRTQTPNGSPQGSPGNEGLHTDWLIKNITDRQKLYHSDCVTLEKGYKLILAWRIIGVAQQ